MTRSMLCAVVLASFSMPALVMLAAQDEVAKPGPGIVMPKPIHAEKPSYTPEAMRAGIQGSVLLTVVVEKDGTVDNVEVTRSLDMMYGLDEAAIKAASQWRFEPGQKDGKPVAVRVTIELTFTLRDKPQNK